MGWEWHDRARTRKGRWGETHKTDQIHAYCLPSQGEAIRNAARQRAMQVDNFVIECCMRYITEDGQIEVSTEQTDKRRRERTKSPRGGKGNPPKDGQPSTATLPGTCPPAGLGGGANGPRADAEGNAPRRH